MKTLVTGATGFVGSAIARSLLEQGQSVRIMRRESSKTDLIRDIQDHVETKTGDVRDREAVREALDGVSHVFHCAALVGFGRGHFERNLMEINVGGTRNVVDEALEAGIERIVHTSSIAALGRSESAEKCLDESARWQESPLNTSYGVSKYRAELEIQRGVAEGLDAVMVNPSVIMGVGRSGENTHQIAERIRDRKLPGVPIGGTNVVDVLDVVEGHLLAMQRGRTGERYILGSENLLWTEIVHMLAKSLGVRPPRFRIPASVGAIVGFLGEIGGMLTRKQALITRESARFTSHVVCYDSGKATRELGLTFRPFSETADRIATALRVGS